MPDPPDCLEPKVLDRWLWAYSAGLLDPEEERRLMWHIAGDPAAQERLANIQNAIDRVAARSDLSLASLRPQGATARAPAPSFFRAALNRLLEGTGEARTQIEERLVAVVVLLQSGLTVRALQPAWASAPVRTTVLSAAGAADASASTHEIVAPDGTKMTVVRVEGRQCDVLVELPDRSKNVVAKVVRLEKDGEEVPCAAVTLQRGSGKFRCRSEGIFEIQLPGGRRISLAFSAVEKSVSDA